MDLGVTKKVTKLDKKLPHLHPTKKPNLHQKLIHDKLKFQIN